MTDSQRWLVLCLVLLAGVLFYLLEPILFPFLVATLLAYMGDPAADRLEARGMSRTLSVVLVFIAFTLLFGLLLLWLVPMLGHQINALVERLPRIIDWLQNQALPRLEVMLGVDVSAFDLQHLRELVRANWREGSDLLGQLLSKATRSSLVFIGWFANLMLIPVVTFYLLRDWDVMLDRINQLLPRNLEGRVSRWARECDEVLGAFVKGQLLVMICLGAVYASGLALIGIDLALLLGLLAGAASIVPYMGFVVGISASLVAAFVQFQDLLHPGLVVMVFIVGQALEGMLLTPWLVGDRIGLHPVAVIFAIMAGGQLFGFTGVLLALPAAAVVMVFLRHLHEGYKGSQLYNAECERR
ncbi:AI-2E family transporter [Motiliproteus sp. SC1-56]|uniref:AI-2E family transporter n=1 Tax=Motiliproteus sp. SC1-56 TaxID=2799565 RepID=UPI001A8CA33D|nr:AI-2E family transporter [Motiliproteus sp. SC1-56]